MKAVALVVCALLVSACGGGGGGGGGGGAAPAPSVALAPTTVSATFIAGTSTPLSLVATASARLASTPYVKIADPKGVLLGSPTSVEFDFTVTADISAEAHLEAARVVASGESS